MPPTRRQLARRRVIAVAALVALATLGAYVPLTLLAPLEDARATVQSVEPAPRPATSPALPGFGSTAIGAVGFDGVLAQEGDTAPRPIASISKVVTALVVLDERPLTAEEEGPSVTLTQADTALYGSYLARGGTVKPMRAGWAFTERELLELTLVSSANNYAELLAGWAFGSQDAFVTAAGAWLAENGLDSTTLVEPTGMSPQNVSTATDLVALGGLALANPVVAGIVGSASVEVPSIGVIENSNDLLGIGGVDGIKTGTLEEAGSCLLFAADYPVGSQTVTVIGVVLGGTDRDSLDVAVQALLTTVREGFREVQLAEAGEAVAEYTTEWGETATAVTADDLSVVVWSDTPIEATISTRAVGEGAEGDAVGSVDFTVDGEDYSVPLELADALEPADPWWRLTHPLDLLPG